MPTFAVRLLSRLRRSVTTWPGPRGWLDSAAVGALTLAAIGGLGFSTGLYRLGPPVVDGLPLRLVVVFLAPGLGEELPFRGLLIPARSEGRNFWLALVVMTPIFVGWHVVEALTFLRPAAAEFLRPDFLSCAALLGVGCAIVRWRTGSIWPAVALHWLMVTIWQTWLGGFRPGS